MLCLNEEFINKISTCKWFANCGLKETDIFDFNVKYVNSREEAELLLKSSKWDDYCLNKKGEFTEFLFINHNEVYNQWNSIFYHIRENYLDNLGRVLEEMSQKHDLEFALPIIKSNIIILCMFNAYFDYYSDDFYENMLKIYLSGHIPCGWKGVRNSGFFIVY